MTSACSYPLIQTDRPGQLDRFGERHVQEKDRQIPTRQIEGERGGGAGARERGLKIKWQPFIHTVIKIEKSMKILKISKMKTELKRFMQSVLLDLNQLLKLFKSFPIIKCALKIRFCTSRDIKFIFMHSCCNQFSLDEIHLVKSGA